LSGGRALRGPGDQPPPGPARLARVNSADRWLGLWPWPRCSLEIFLSGTVQTLTAIELYVSPPPSRFSNPKPSRASCPMSLNVAVCPMCGVLLQGEEHQGIHRQPFLDRISYPAALLVAAALGFEGALVGLSASETATTRQGPPTALRVEKAKPPQCSIETPDRLVFL